MLYVTYLLDGLLMIGLPVLLGIVLARRLGTKWGLFGAGMVTFILSQVVHLPLLWGLTTLFANKVLPAPPEPWHLLFNAVVLGLAAGLCEEGARYLILRYWMKSARTWRAALMFGAGHGGMEAMIFGGLVIVTYVAMVAMRQTNGAALPLPAAQQALAARQIAAYWSAAWPVTLLGAVERVFAICVHLSAAVLVLQALTRRNLLWLVAAVLWHAVIDGTSVIAVGTGLDVFRIEAVVGAFAVLALVIVFALRPRQPEPEVEAGPSAVVSGAPPSPRDAGHTEADEQQAVEDSKYL
jgi:uncharacterized membrane protein YhfC